MGKNKTDVLEMLAKNEELINQLYNVYSGKFPDYKDFWRGLAVEETQHAVWIREFRSQVRQGHVQFNEDRFDVDIMGKLQDYVKDMINTAQEQEIPLKGALNIALDIESGLIEKRFFEVFETDAKELRFVLKVLSDSTKRHFDRIQKVSDKIRKD